jgi:DNA polymerase-3 subunit alpha
LFDKPISEITLNINDIDEVDKIYNLLGDEGSTEVKINVKDDKKNLTFKLKNKRSVDRKAINMLKNEGISTIIQ